MLASVRWGRTISRGLQGGLRGSINSCFVRPCLGLDKVIYRESEPDKCSWAACTSWAKQIWFACCKGTSARTCVVLHINMTAQTLLPPTLYPSSCGFGGCPKVPTTTVCIVRTEQQTDGRQHLLPTFQSRLLAKPLSSSCERTPLPCCPINRLRSQANSPFLTPASSGKLSSLRTRSNLVPAVCRAPRRAWNSFQGGLAFIDGSQVQGSGPLWASAQ